MEDLEKVTVSFEIEPLALDILKQQAVYQGLTLNELVAFYTGNYATAFENRHGNALVSDAWNNLIKRNAPTTFKGSPRYKAPEE